jgi:hypothetical protein
MGGGFPWSSVHAAHTCTRRSLLECALHKLVQINVGELHSVTRVVCLAGKGVGGVNVCQRLNSWVDLTV